MACLKVIFCGSSPVTRRLRESSKVAPPPTTATSTSRTRSPITISEPQQQRVGLLQALDDRRGEAGAVGAVGHAVVEREGERQQQARHDLAAAHDGLFPPARHAKDGD